MAMFERQFSSTWMPRVKTDGTDAPTLTVWATTETAPVLTVSLSLQRSIVHGAERDALRASVMRLILTALCEQASTIGVTVTAESDDVAWLCGKGFRREGQDDSLANNEEVEACHQRGDHLRRFNCRSDCHVQLPLVNRCRSPSLATRSRTAGVRHHLHSILHRSLSP